MIRIFDICLSLEFLALFFSGFQIINKPVRIVPFDLVFLFCSISMILYMILGKKVRFGTEPKLIAIICLVLVIWLTLQALRSRDIIHAITLLAIMIRDIGTLFLTTIMIIDYQRKELTNIINRYYILALFIIITAMIFYFFAISNFNNVLLNPRPGLIYRTGENMFPHFQGFSHNPIYLSLLILMSIAIGLATHSTAKLAIIFKRFGLLMLLFAFFITFSRGAVVVMLLGMILVSIIMYIYPKLRHILVKRGTKRILLGLLLGIIILSFFRLPGYESTIIERVVFRFQNARWESRAENYWWTLISEIRENPLIGYGLRAAELRFYGKSIENSYLDILYDQGMVGLLIWVLIFGSVLIIGILKLRNNLELLPWIYMWIVVIFAMGYISMQYDPLVWVIAGVIIGWKKININESQYSMII